MATSLPLCLAWWDGVPAQTDMLPDTTRQTVAPSQTIKITSNSQANNNIQGNQNATLNYLNSPYVWGGAAIVGTYLVYQLYQWWTAEPENTKESTENVDTQNQEQAKQTT